MHYFDPNVAAEHGIAEAVIINHFQFWIAYNKRSQRNEHEGRTWTYQSNKTLAEAFPYLSPKSIWSAIDRLTKSGVLMKGNFNAHKYDRTLWYAFILEDFWIKPVGEFHFVKSKSPASDSAEPIPDDPTDNLTNNETLPADGVPKNDPPKKDPPKPKTKKTPGAPDLEWQRWVDAWFVHYENLHGGIKPAFGPVQAASLKSVRAHLCSIALPVDGKTPDDCGFIVWEYILLNWAKLDDWQQGEFDLSVVYKKINNILSNLKNGTTNRGNNTGGAKVGTSQERINAIKNY